MTKKTGADEEVVMVTVTGPDGSEADYVQDTVIPWEGRQFAVLIAVPASASEAEEEPDVILARIDADENGEPAYLPPTDEEYDAVAAAYEDM